MIKIERKTVKVIAIVLAFVSIGSDIRDIIVAKTIVNTTIFFFIRFLNIS